MIKISELTHQQLTLVFARHEGVDVYCGRHPGSDKILAVNTSDGFYELDWNTVGPAWEREWDAVVENMESKFRILGEAEYRYYELLMQTKTAKSLARALCEYWYPNGVPEEMLK